MPHASQDKIIVVGVDGSPSSQDALRWAVQQAELTGDTVKAVMAWQYPVYAGGVGWGPVVLDEGVDIKHAAEQTLAGAVEQVSHSGSAVRIEQQVVEGYAPRVLVDTSAEADLLVVGSRGHGTFSDAMLGSVSQHCAHHSKCPVVIVRHAS